MDLELYRDTSGNHRWRLNSATGDSVATSGQPFARRSTAKRAGRNFANRVGDYSYEAFEDDGGAHRWRARAANSEVVAESSQTFPSDAAALEAGRSFAGGSAGGEAAPAAQSTGPRWESAAAWLAAGLGVVGSAIGIVGLADADLDRAVVNEPFWVPFVFALILLGVLSGVVAGIFRGSTWFVAAGAVLFGIGLYGLVVFAAKAKSASDRPRVTAFLKATPEGLRVQGKILAAGLEVEQHTFVRIVGISSDDKLANEHIGHPRGKEEPLDRQPVYSSRTGAASDGTVEVAFDVPVGAGLYERLDVEATISDDEKEKDEDTVVATGAATDSCDQETSNIGCQSLMVPPTGRRPRLVARWKLPPSGTPVLDVTARMGDLSADDRVLLSVLRMKGNDFAGRIYAAAWAPDPTGAVEEQIAIPVAPRGQSLCVVLRNTRGSTRFSTEAGERAGPCQPRSRGMAVQLRPPPKS